MKVFILVTQDTTDYTGKGDYNPASTEIFSTRESLFEYLQDTSEGEDEEWVNNLKERGVAKWDDMMTSIVEKEIPV